MKNKVSQLAGLMIAWATSLFTASMAFVDSSYSQRVRGTMLRLQHGDGFLVALSDITGGTCKYIKDASRVGACFVNSLFVGSRAVFAMLLLVSIAILLFHPVTASAGTASAGIVFAAGRFNMDYEPVAGQTLPKIKLSGTFDSLDYYWDHDKRSYPSFKMDAEGYNIFFARQLEYVMTQIFWKQYPEYKATRLIPVSREAGPGATTITFRMYDRAGSFGLISNYANDLPRSSVKASEKITPVKPFGGSYGYNLDEIRAAKFTNVPLEMMEAEATRNNYEQMLNKVGFLARANDPTYGGLIGLVYQPNAIIARPAYGQWTTSNAANAAYMYQDLINAVTLQGTITNAVEMPDTLLLPFAEYIAITTTPFTLPVGGGGSGTVAGFTTVADYFLAHNPSVRQIEYVIDLAGVTPCPSTPTDMTTSTDVAIFYKRDPSKLKFHIPQPFEQVPPQERNLEWVVPCHAKVGGVISPYPMSIMIVELSNPAT